MKLVFSSYSPAWYLYKKLALKAVHLYLNDPENALQRQITAEARMLVSDLLAKGQEGLDPVTVVEFSAASIIYSVCFHLVARGNFDKTKTMLNGWTVFEYSKVWQIMLLMLCLGWHPWSLKQLS